MSEKKGLAVCQQDNWLSVVFWLVMVVASIVILLDIIFWRP